MPNPTEELRPQYPDEAQEKKSGVTADEEPLSLNFVDEQDFVSIIDQSIQNSENFAKDKLRLPTRRKVLEDFWLGKHHSTEDFYDWEMPYQDNLIYRDFETRLALITGRMPDILTFAPDRSEMKRENARAVQQILRSKLSTEETRRLVKDGLRQHGLNFTAAFKVRWNPYIGELGESGDPVGDIETSLVRPDRFGFDHTATIPQTGFSADNMDFIYEWVEECVAVIVAKFPAKKDALFKELGIKRGTTKQMMRKIKYQEIWYTWYDDANRPVECVAWKFHTLLLGNMKNPNYDYEGYSQVLATGETKPDGLPETKVGNFYRNHFDRPRKPYILISYQNLGKSPYDDTTVVEQAIPMQKVANKRGWQITQIADNAVPRLVFAGEYITKEEASNITPDPRENIWIGAATDAHAAVQTITAAPPSPILFNDLIGIRAQIDSMFSTHSTTRGETTGNESGRSKQITREGDLTLSDDMVSITVDRIIDELANWYVQLMKLRYKDNHYIRDLGPAGETVFTEMTQDKIDDGLVVKVKASTTDRQTRKAQAFELAQIKAIDPMSLYEQLDMPDPKELTERFMAYQTAQQDGGARYLDAIGVQTGAPAGTTGGEDPNLKQDIQLLQQGQQPPARKIDPGYLTGLSNYVNSPEFSQQAPQVQQAVLTYIQKLKSDAITLPQQQQPTAPIGA